jgi:hypothetical protein
MTKWAGQTKPELVLFCFLSIHLGTEFRTIDYVSTHPGIAQVPMPRCAMHNAATAAIGAEMAFALVTRSVDLVGPFGAQHVRCA